MVGIEIEKGRLGREIESLNGTLESLMAHVDSLAAERELSEHQLKAQKRKGDQLGEINVSMVIGEK